MVQGAQLGWHHTRVEKFQLACCDQPLGQRYAQLNQSRIRLEQGGHIRAIPRFRAIEGFNVSQLQIAYLVPQEAPAFSAHVHQKNAKVS